MEHFQRIRSIDTMKRKQFLKGVEQIAQEGAIQIFKTPYTGMEEVAQYVAANVQPGDLVITLGCGDIYKASKMMVADNQ